MGGGSPRGEWVLASPREPSERRRGSRRPVLLFCPKYPHGAFSNTMTVHIHGLTRPPTTDERTSERANEATKIERPERRKRARGTATVRSSSATPSLSRPERVAKRQKKPALHAVAGSTRKLRSPSKTGLAPAEVKEEQDEPHVEGASQRAPSTRVRRWDRPAPRRASARTLSDRRGSRSKARPGKRTRSRTAVDEPSTRVPQRQPPNPATTVSPASPVPPPARDPRPAADARKAGKRRPKTRVAPPTHVFHHPTVRGEVAGRVRTAGRPRGADPRAFRTSAAAAGCAPQEPSQTT